MSFPLPVLLPSANDHDVVTVLSEVGESRDTSPLSFVNDPERYRELFPHHLNKSLGLIQRQRTEILSALNTGQGRPECSDSCAEESQY